MTQKMRYVQLPNGEKVPALGQGTWHMGEHSSTKAQEIQALRYGVDHGLTLIDTAEMYADGKAESLVGEAISGLRQKVFLVSKVLPSHADLRGTIAACEASLNRLNTDYLDLYLLHWPGSIPIEETVEAMETLVNQGKIRYWGVSNFDVDELRQLMTFVDMNAGRFCTNQVLYNLSRRAIEYDLLPWSEKRGLPIMAYSPIEQGRLLNDPTLIELAEQHKATSAQIALAWVLRRLDVIAIPKASTEQHVLDNLNCLNIQLSQSDLERLDRAFPPPERKRALEML